MADIVWIMNTDRATLNFLNAFPEDTQREGTSLQEAGNVVQIFGDHLTIRGRVRVGDVNLRTTIRLKGNHWEGECSSGKVHGPAVYATMLERIARGGQIPETPNEIGNDSIQEILEDKLDRDLDAGEERYLGTLEKRYRRYELEGEIHDHDLVRLNRKWEVESYEPLELWAVKPDNILEFWNYIAHTFQKRKVGYPPFMEAITDLESTSQRLQEWERQREIDSWKERITDVLELPLASPREPLEFRLVVTSTEARLQMRSREHGDEPVPYETLSNRGPVKELVDRSENGGFELDSGSEMIWHHFRNHWETTSFPELRLENRQSAEVLNHLFHQPLLHSRLVTLDETPFFRVPEPLRWVCHDDAESEGDLLLQLTTGDGEEVPYALRLLPGREPRYVSDEAVFRGPHFSVGKTTEVLPRVRLPRMAVENAGGIEYLSLLGAGLPESLRGRVEEMVMQVTVEARLEEKTGVADNEVVLLAITAADPSGLRQERLTKEGWNTLRDSDERSRKLIRFDRGQLHPIPALLETLVSSWDASREAFRVRVTRTFPERFRDWAEALPPDVELILDAKLKSLLSAPVRAKVKFEVEEKGIDWFDLRIQVDAKGLDLSQSELQALVNAHGNFVRMQNGSWLRLQLDLDERQQKAINRLGLDPFDLSGQSHRMHVLQLADPLSSSVFDRNTWERISERASSLKLRVRPKLPPELDADLRPYQVEGFQFLSYLSENSFGGILADDMGLGKTVQSLTWLLWLRSRDDGDDSGQTSLVVCPKSVLDVWANEVKKFAPSLRTQILYSKEELDIEAARNSLDLLVINYAQLRGSVEALKQIPWLAIILDEGQQIKNPDSKAARAARELEARNRLVLTGTPLENRLLDIWSIMTFAMPGVLGDRKYFRERFDRRKDTGAQTRLAARLRPFLLRRTKNQVALDLPSRTEEDIFCVMEEDQKQLYENELARIRASLLEMKTDASVRKNSFVILQGLMRLRQICCHPALINAKFAEASSAKLQALFYLIDQLQEEGHKVLVFSQFTSMLAIIERRLKDEDRPYTILTGKTKDRHKVVENFQHSKEPTCFLLSLKAGGSGLNLTAASYVVLYDPWWNPAVEQQAIDRTHRIGQTNRVNAYRLLMRDSVEEKIRLLQNQKNAMVEGILGQEGFARNLERKDLEFLFGDAPVVEPAGNKVTVFSSST